MRPSAPSSPPATPAKSDWSTLRRLFPYLWVYKWRVIAALSFMIGAKVANVGVPVLLKNLIDALSIKPGDTAVIELLGGETVTAVVRSATPSLDPDSKTATIVLTPQGIGGLTPGQGLRARIKPRGGGDSALIALPEEAVQTVEGNEVVFVKTTKGYQATTVVTGKRGGGRIEIVDGLAAGAVVVTKGAFMLKAELGKGEAEH